MFCEGFLTSNNIKIAFNTFISFPYPTILQNIAKYHALFGWVSMADVIVPYVLITAAITSGSYVP